MLNKELENSLNDAFQQAHELRHEFITVEHLLLCMMKNKSAREVYIAAGGTPELLEKELDAYLTMFSKKISYISQVEFVYLE